MVFVIQRKVAEPAADVAAAMALELIPLISAGGLTVPAALALPVYRALSAALPPGDPAGPAGGIRWDWMWTDHRVPAADRDAAARSVAAVGVVGGPLDVSDPVVAAEVKTLLDGASPRHSAEPGDSRVQLWYGFRRRVGRELVACAAWYEAVPGIPLLASVAVDAGLRRSGLGRALMVAIIEAAFDQGCPAVTVDLYADNDSARRLYLSLGFRLEQEFSSWSLAGHDRERD